MLRIGQINEQDSSHVLIERQNAVDGSWAEVARVPMTDFHEGIIAWYDAFTVRVGEDGYAIAEFSS